MMMDFSKFDNAINKEQMKKDVEAARQNTGNTEVPDGTYTAKVDKLEIKATKDGRPMLSAQFRIMEGEYKKKCVFLNRVLYGTKNDANMIASAEGFLKKLEPSEDVGVVAFESYSQFADLVLDIMEDIDGALEYEIEYKKDAFNPISINEVFEI